MQARLFNRVTRAVIAALVLIAIGGQLAVAAARPEPGARATRRGFNLFAETFVIFLTNRVACGINNLGEICVDPGNSPIGGGGFWPRGTPDQYIFNSGLQIAGVIASDAGFAWAGDTTGAYFMDARGTQQQGEGITPVYNSLDAGDIQNWPAGAVVTDTAIYASQLIGRNTISQQDLWVRAWDGSPFLLSGRTHPMGILAEIRGLAWNFPSGNEDILYFVFNFYNISASDPAVYAGLDPSVRDDVAAIGQRFQTQVQSVLGVDIPDQGYTINETFAAFTMDPDVEDASHNHSTAILPFSLAAAYKHDWQAPSWTFPPDIFGPPFAAAPGFVGVKYLRSPADPVTGEQFGLTMFSNTRNAATAFPDPVGVVQLWRYLSGRINTTAGDNPCTLPQADVIAKRLCFLDQVDVDTRFYMSSGPFTLEPGKVFTIVVAYVHAAPVASAITIGQATRPGIPPQPADLAAGTDTIRDIDRAVGWVSHADGGGEGGADGEISQDEVVTLPRSLLQKSLVAQEVFDKKFLLPSAPESPNFFLIPGDGQVTVVWEPSPSESTGDPFFAVAGDPTSALFDPNFRQFDVEGYRIYRGRTAGNLTLIAQFDANGTFFRDYTGAVNYGNCAPELGIFDDCPETFDFPITNTGDFNDVDISGNLIQVGTGARVELADGSVFVITADTAVVGGNSGKPALSNTGIPFAFVDEGVLSSLTYFYAVTAFDVNSVASGPSSLESPAVARPVTPRAPAGNARAALVVESVQGDDGQALDILAPWPAVDPETGTFNGNVPPTADGRFGFLASVAEALPAGDILLRIDSVGQGGQGGFGIPDPTVYVTMEAGGNVVTASTNTNQPSFGAGAASSYSLSAPLVPYDSTLSGIVGLNFTDATVRMPVEFRGTSIPMAHAQPAVATGAGRYGVAGYATSRYIAHSRWFDEGGSEPPDPTITAYADSANHAGTLTGVGRIWIPSAYRLPLDDATGGGIDQITAFLRGYAAAASVVWYPADFVVTWGAGGSVTVRDVTHNVTLPFTEASSSGYGFLNLGNVLATGLDQAGYDGEFTGSMGGNGEYNILTYQHLFMIEPTCSGYWGFVAADCVVLSETAELSPLDFNTDGVLDGMGIVLVINGEPYYMEMTSLPAAGTAWHLRAITGRMTADCTPSVGPLMTDCSNYTFEPNPVRPTNVPGLQFVMTVQQQFAVNPSDSVDLDRVHTVPDPYYVTNAMEITTNRKVLKWVNLPAQAIIRVYSLSGVLVNVVTHNDPAGGGEAVWDLRNRNNQFVASGVYFYHIETPNGQTKVGRFTVVNFAQ